MMKILVINGYPYKEKTGSALQKAYMEGAEKAGHIVHSINISDLNFSYNLPQGYHQLPEPEEDIRLAWKLISEADHLVFFYPNWWGTYPAMLKGFIDRVFIPGFAFKYANGGSRKKLLSGKSARIIVTMDQPAWYYRYVIGAAGSKALKKAVLTFCGITPVRVHLIGNIRKLSDIKLKKLLDRFSRLGREVDMTHHGKQP